MEEGDILKVRYDLKMLWQPKCRSDSHFHHLFGFWAWIFLSPVHKKNYLRLTQTTVVLDHPREIPSKQRQYLPSHHHIRHSHRLQHGNRVRDQSDHLRKISHYMRIMLTNLDLKTPCPQSSIIFSYLKTEVERKNTRHRL